MKSAQIFALIRCILMENNVSNVMISAKHASEHQRIVQGVRQKGKAIKDSVYKIVHPILLTKALIVNNVILSVMDVQEILLIVLSVLLVLSS